MKGGQVALEFVVLINSAFLLLVIFSIVVSNHSTTLNSEQELRRVKDMAYTIADEIVAASVVEDGYSRTFMIPNITEGYTMSARIEYNAVIVNTSKEEYAVGIPPVAGALVHGANTIRKQDGNIYVN